MPTTINCPTCLKEHHWESSKPWSPFCSERCKLIDLGAWASEKHVIPGEPITKESDVDEIDFDLRN